MKLLIVIFLSAPVLACSLPPGAAMRLSEKAAKEAVTAKTKRTDLLARYQYPFWYVRSTKPSCVEYKVGVDGGKGDCKMTGKILAEKACP